MSPNFDGCFGESEGTLAPRMEARGGEGVGERSEGGMESIRGVERVVEREGDTWRKGCGNRWMKGEAGSGD